MSNFDEKNNRPTERLTVAGIAAVIVVGVFVVCVILILAKSLFPSNDSSVPDGIYTGTKTESSSVAEATSSDDVSSEDASIDSATDSATDSSLDSVADSTADSVEDSTSDSTADGETATLLETAYLRSANSSDAEPILSISAGETVTVLDRPSDSEYVNVSYYGTEGWVWYGYLSS
ncbi:MAG: SH3 domain-containing protein [Ruminococcus sp.]|nr:SH3 domain-containing protein [Ruminococcus sp.]